MAQCFVIQPFSEPFDTRFTDTFEPAIKDADLTPYRVDRDASAAIPINRIETSISESEVCFADVTTDNPNVWFELGFAIAHKKLVCIVCSTERKAPYPFDIQHRKIIKYGTESRTAYEKARSEITERLCAIVKNELNLRSIGALSSTSNTSGLGPHELAALTTIASSSGPMPEDEIRRGMDAAGFNSLGAAFAMRSLKEKKLVEGTYAQSANGYEWFGFTVTDAGWAWLRENEDKLQLRKPPRPNDDIPF